MTVESLERYRPIRKNVIEVFLIGQFARAKHSVIPTVPENPAFTRILRCVGTQLISNLRKVLGAFQAHPYQLGGAFHEVNVAIDETREHEFAAGIDHFCAHAAHSLDYGVVTHRDDLAVMNRYGLGPRLLRVFRINAAVNDDHIRRLDDSALRAGHRNSAEQKRE
jgi:hypothetical protein